MPVRGSRAQKAAPLHIGLACLAASTSGPSLAQSVEGSGPVSQEAQIVELKQRLEKTDAELAELRAEVAALHGARKADDTPASPGLSKNVASAAPSPDRAASADMGTPTSAATAEIGRPATPAKVAQAAGAAAAGATAAGASPAVAAQAAAAATAATERLPIFGAGIPSSAAVSRLDAGHPVISTPDGRFSASLLGVMQFDIANYYQSPAGPLSSDFRRAGSASDSSRGRNLADGSDFRRARIGIAGRLFSDFEYTVLFDFGGSGEEDSGHVQELWLQYSGLKPAHIRVGAFPPSIGLEDAGSTNGMPFLERPAPSDIARSLAGGDYREAAQIIFNGKRWFVSAAITGRLVNTAGSSTVQPYDNQLSYVGRAAVLPISNKDNVIHLGVHGSYVAHPANSGGPDATTSTALSPIQLRERPELRVDGTRLIDTGAIDAIHAYTLGAEFAAQHRNLLVQAEYEQIGIDRRSSSADPVFRGFYVEGTWILTGQRRRYNDGNFAFDGPEVARSFDPRRGQWGVWELALRYSDIDLNYRRGAAGTALATGSVRGGDQKIATIGVNWYLNSIARIMFDAQHVTIARLSPNPTTYLTPVGADIGQQFWTSAARFQLAF